MDHNQPQSPSDRQTILDGIPSWLRQLMGPSPRPERGEVRLLILHAIAEQPCHGYQVIRSIEQKSNGTYRPSSGSVYPNLRLFEKTGHALTSQQQGLTIFTISSKGRAELSGNGGLVEEIYERLQGGIQLAEHEDFGVFWQQIGRMIRLIRIAGRQGRLGSREWVRILKVIDRACREIENLFRYRDQ